MTNMTLRDFSQKVYFWIYITPFLSVEKISILFYLNKKNKK